jgi:hypothetical protein
VFLLATKLANLLQKNLIRNGLCNSGCRATETYVTFNVARHPEGVLEARPLSDKLKCRHFLGAMEKLRKASVSSVLSVRPSVLLFVRMEQLCSNCTDFHKMIF